MGGETILVVDDEPDIRGIVEEILTDEGYSVVTAENGSSARLARQSTHFDLVLLDIWMPDTDGLALLKEWAGDSLDAQVVMISGHGTVETAVDAIRCGAYDFLEKPLSTAKLLVTVERALQARRLRQENLRLRNQLEPAATMVGTSAVLQALREEIRRIAATDSWVLITGEPGSGKGVAARRLHQESGRRAAPFIDVSLAAIPAQNMAVQLFGSIEGEVVRAGHFEEAQSGTLFLDEIGDLDLGAQINLLSALEEGRFMRVGGNQFIDIDVRVVAATNQDLEQAVADGRFREDLYYRLNVVPLHVPPLREHLEDIPDLVDFYVDWMVKREQLPYRRFSSAAIDRLARHHWPGNVRELKNIVQRLMILNRGERVTGEEVAAALSGRRSAPEGGVAASAFDLRLREARDHFERSYFLHHLNKASGNISEVANTTGIERTHLYRKLKQLGIDQKSLKAGTKS